jgi:1-acyl-sn-glycerol-3-phosphate acyltransferase
MTPMWDEARARVESLGLPWNAYGSDPYGISKRDLIWFFMASTWLYRHYFRVRAVGCQQVPQRGRAMLVGNHSGGVALDALIVITAMFLEKDPPRLVQVMAEKFLARTPFASRWAARLGHLTGTPEHVERLLGDERLLLVFPEGARGTAKLFWDRHSLVQFGGGFLRSALQARCPIIPFGFVGGGDAIPTIANSYELGRLIGAPYVPFTPWVLPLPLPVPLAVCFGAPLTFEGRGNEDDATIESKVGEVKRRIADLVAEGRRSLQGE